MASGKQTPRQKMINLMYLVFIAMLALNMSKEVLSAFGSMNEKLDRSNESYVKKNIETLGDLIADKDKNDRSRLAAETAVAANKLSKTYIDYLATQKELLLDNPKFVNDSTGLKTEYRVMDQSSLLDEKYHKSGKITEAGQEFLTQMDTYKNGMLALLGDAYPTITPNINDYFDTGIIVDGEGKPNDYIEYNFVGFPLISSLTKMTQIQNDVNTIEYELLTKLDITKKRDDGKLTNYKSVMTTSRGAYYTNTTFDGMLSLGRIDASTRPVRVELKLDGNPIKENQYEFDGGRLVLKVGTGSVGDHEITGKLVYLQDGKENDVPVNQKFTTINKPNAATVKADSMNVVYRGIPNPMTISFAGIEDKDVRVNAIGLSKVKGNKKYSILPQKGRFVTINVSGTLPDNGGTVSDKATFRIKPLPPPVATINDQISADGRFKMPRKALEVADIGAKMGKNFNFNLNLKVIGFSVSVPDVPTVKVEGARFNERAKNAIRKAKRGQKVEIFDVRVKAVSNSKVRLDKIPQIVVELAN
jgi:gliding motility-associated protein GldM